MYEQAYQLLRQLEGGYANDPADRGGATIFGISSKYHPNDFAYVRSLLNKGETDRAERYVKGFYKKNYWDKIGADNLDPAIGLMAFDSAVHHGETAARKLLKRSGGDPSKFIEERKKYINAIIKNDPTQARFQKGWQNRIDTIDSVLRGQGSEDVVYGDDQGDVLSQEEEDAIFGQPAPLSPDEENAIFGQPEDLVPQQQKPSLGRTVLEQGLQGGTFGFADELSNRIAAAIAPLLPGGSALGGQTYKDRLQSITEQSDQILLDQMQQRPLTSMAAQVAGGLGTGAAAMKALPQAGAIINAAAKTAPVATSAGIGGVQGTLYGFGSGTGDAGERAKSAMLSGLAGATVGGLMQPVLDKGARFVSGLIKKAPESQAKQVAANVGGAAPQTVDDLAKLTLRQGSIIPMTKGARTANESLQSIEEMALRGLVTDEAKIAMEGARSVQDKALKKAMASLGDFTQEADANDLVQNVVDTITKKQQSYKAAVDRAYATARELSGGVKIGRDDIVEGMIKPISSIARDDGYDLTHPELSGVKSLIKKISVFGKDMGSHRISAVKLDALESLRSQASRLSRESSSPMERSFAKKLVQKYDGFMGDLAERALVNGDRDAILAFKNAVKTRAEYGRLFQGGNIVEDIIEKSKTPDDVIKDMFGAAVSARQGLDKQLAAIMKATGNDEKVLSDLRAAQMRLIIDKVSGVIDPADASNVLTNSASLKKYIDLLANSQRTYTKMLFGENSIPVLKTLSKDLEKLKRQPGVVNASNSANIILRAMKGMNGIPFLNMIPQTIEHAQKYNQTNAIKKSIQEIIKDMPQFASKSPLFNPAVSGTIGASVAETPIQEQGLTVTVTPYDQYR